MLEVLFCFLCSLLFSGLVVSCLLSIPRCLSWMCMFCQCSVTNSSYFQMISALGYSLVPITFYNIITGTVPLPFKGVLGSLVLFASACGCRFWSMRSRFLGKELWMIISFQCVYVAGLLLSLPVCTSGSLLWMESTCIKLETRAFVSRVEMCIFLYLLFVWTNILDIR